MRCVVFLVIFAAVFCFFYHKDVRRCFSVKIRKWHRRLRRLPEGKVQFQQACCRSIGPPKVSDHEQKDFSVAAVHVACLPLYMGHAGLERIHVA